MESGASDLTLEAAVTRNSTGSRKMPNLTGVAHPVSDIGMIFITNREPMLDKNVRLAMIHAVDKKAIVDKLMRGYAVVIDTLEAPQYAAYDPSIKVKYDPELAEAAAGGVRLSARQPGQVHHPDHARLQAQGLRDDPGRGRHVEARSASRPTSRCYEIAKHYELRARHELAPAAFYNWGNSIGDPSTSTGFAMFGPSPHSAWKTEDVDKMIGPLWGEKDEAKRIAGYKAVDRYIAEQGYVLPLLQYKQPVVYRKTLQVHAAHGAASSCRRTSRRPDGACARHGHKIPLDPPFQRGGRD